jgi:hypothetical protein
MTQMPLTFEPVAPEPGTHAAMLLGLLKAKGQITTSDIIWDSDHKISCWTKCFTRLRRLGWPIETLDIEGSRQKLYRLAA